MLQQFRCLARCAVGKAPLREQERHGWIGRRQAVCAFEPSAAPGAVARLLSELGGGDGVLRLTPPLFRYRTQNRPPRQAAVADGGSAEPSTLRSAAASA